MIYDDDVNDLNENVGAGVGLKYRTKGSHTSVYVQISNLVISCRCYAEYRKNTCEKKKQLQGSNLRSSIPFMPIYF